jgi:hypothetical protein
VNGLDLALITGSFTLGAVVVTFSGNLWLETVRERRTRRRERKRAVTELLTATVELMYGVEVLRAAYDRQSGWPEWSRRGADMVSILGLMMPPGEMPNAPREWLGIMRSQLGDWHTLGPAFDRALSALTRMDHRQRVAALDVNAVLLPRVARFYAALVEVTLGHDDEPARVAGTLAGRVGELLEVIVARRRRKYARARRRAESAHAALRGVAMPKRKLGRPRTRRKLRSQ